MKKLILILMIAGTLAAQTLQTVLLVPVGSNKYYLYIHSPDPVYGFQFQIEGGDLAGFQQHRDFELEFHDYNSVFVLDYDLDPFSGRGIICMLQLADDNLGRTLVLNDMVFAGAGGEVITMPETVQCETNPSRGSPFKVALQSLRGTTKKDGNK